MTPSSIQHGRLPFVSVLCALLLAFVCGPAAAAETELTLGASASVSSSPYKGYGTQWEGLPVLSLESPRFYIRGYNAGVKLINTPHVEWSFFAGYDDTTFAHADSSDAQLRLLDDRSESGILGTELRLISPYGMFHVSGSGDVLGNSNGLKGDIGIIQSLEFGPLELIPAAGFHWSDARYNTYYYGVSKRESRTSGLRAYKPNAGFSPYLSLAVDYSLTEQLELLVQGEVTFLDSAVENSPMVDSAHTQGMTLALTYTF